MGKEGFNRFIFLHNQIRNSGDSNFQECRIPMVVVVVSVWYFDLQLPMQSVPIITNVVSSIPTQAIQHYVIKFVGNLRQVGGFLLVL